MMGTSDPQPSMRKIRPLIDTTRIRQLCERRHRSGSGGRQTTWLPS